MYTFFMNKIEMWILEDVLNEEQGNQKIVEKREIGNMIEKVKQIKIRKKAC